MTIPGATPQRPGASSNGCSLNTAGRLRWASSVRSALSTRSRSGDVTGSLPDWHKITVGIMHVDDDLDNLVFHHRGLRSWYFTLHFGPLADLEILALAWLIDPTDVDFIVVSYKSTPGTEPIMRASHENPFKTSFDAGTLSECDKTGFSNDTNTSSLEFLPAFSLKIRPVLNRNQVLFSRKSGGDKTRHWPRKFLILIGVAFARFMWS